MSKKSVIKNYIYNLSYQILILIVPLITTPYLSRVLGAENIGIYSYTLSVTTYFILFGSLGVAMYGQREIAYLQDNRKDRSKAFIEILIMRFITLGVFFIIFHFTIVLNGNYKMYYRILMLEFFANSIDISWFFQGLEEFKKTVSRNIIVKIISVIMIFILVKNQDNLKEYFIIYVLSNLIGNVTLWMYLPKYIEKVKLKELHIFRHLKPTIGLFIPQIAIQIYTVLDKTMIGTIISDKSEVGFYEQAQKIVKILMAIATSLGTVMMPRIAATYAKSEINKVREYMNKSFKFILMLAFPLMLGIISVAYHFVPVFYGEGYEKVIVLLCVISPIIVLVCLSNVTGNQYLLPTKQQNKYTISVVIGAIVNFILNLLLIKSWASVGASIATVIAEFSVTTTQFILIRKEIKLSNVIKISYKYMLSSVVMFLFSIVIGLLVKSNFIAVSLQVIVSVFIYFMMLIVLKDQMIFEGIKIIKNKFLKLKE